MLQSDDNRPPLNDLGAFNQAMSLLVKFRTGIAAAGWTSNRSGGGESAGLRRSRSLRSPALPSPFPAGQQSSAAQTDDQPERSPREEDVTGSGGPEETGQQRVGLFVNFGELDQLRLLICFFLGFRFALFNRLHFIPLSTSIGLM
ncbi:hypothetical protein [uncultured Parasphingorhabdus sp.]|uniref:hypothetical protein n=1 Tax=uncultured Parasphingorhabdus sp. TaxID=2709694 RepID=UPI00374A3D24